MKANEALKTIASGKLDKKISSLYTADNVLSSNKRYVELVDLFINRFGDNDVHIVSAPGRTELIGNHTDHNSGCVIAASTHLDTIACVEATSNNIITFCSKGYAEVTIDLSSLETDSFTIGTTDALLRGMAVRFKSLGYKIQGFNAMVSSNVPSGSGLSSSASVEVLFGTIVSFLFNDNVISTMEIAITGQWAEVHYFDKQVGLMDELACITGGISHIDFFDPEKVVVSKIVFTFENLGYILAVVNTGGTHSGLNDIYDAIPIEMGKVASILHEKELRYTNKKEFYTKISEIREKAGDRSFLRALHFYNENERVEHIKEAFVKNDMKMYLNTINESGLSSWIYLQNCSIPSDPQDQPIALALALTREFLQGDGACRVHGGGFHGTIQAYIPLSQKKEYKQYMESVFGKDSVIYLTIRKDGCCIVI